MAKEVVVVPRGKQSGAWTIKGSNPPPATNGVDVFYGQKTESENTEQHT